VPHRSLGHAREQLHRSRGRGVARRRIASCWRSTRFSATRLARGRRAASNAPTTASRSASIPQRFAPHLVPVTGESIRPARHAGAAAHPSPQERPKMSFSSPQAFSYSINGLRRTNIRFPFQRRGARAHATLRGRRETGAERPTSPRGLRAHSQDPCGRPILKDFTEPVSVDSDLRPFQAHWNGRPKLASPRASRTSVSLSPANRHGRACWPSAHVRRPPPGNASQNEVFVNTRRARAT
jgi:hypothetical protein